MERTEGALLGGRVRYMQPAEGYRTGIEPVLMAASVPARAGQVVLEAGCGAGAGLLCLLARVPGVRGIGIELDPFMAAIARDNLAPFAAAAAVHAENVAEAAAFGPVDHAMANPPWHDPAATPPTDARRRLAKQQDGAGLAAWVAPLAATLAPRGTLTLALPAAATATALALLLGCGLGRVAIVPLWPRAGIAARIVLVQARRGRESCRIGPGLVLHAAGGGYTGAAEAVLRGGAGLDA